MYKIFDRIITSEIKRLEQKFPIIALTGPRQSGKTTLLKHLYKDKTYISLEDPDIKQFATQDPRGFLEDVLRNKSGVILDEVQRVPDLFSYIQTIVDKTNQPGQFILSGSQNFLLLEKITQSLAGRVALLNLLPLSITELANANQIPTEDSLNTLLYNGCYPRIYQHHLQATDWYSNYINTYIERDVRSIKNITDLSQFQTFLKICAGHCGQLINLSAIGNDCGISHNTAKSWLSLLETSFIVFKLQPYYKNFQKRLVKSHKLYFYDSGLVCNLLGIQSPQQLTNHYLRGGIFESYIIAEIQKKILNHGQKPNLYFWQDKNKTEIDCIIEQGQKITALEIKSGKTISPDYFKGLEKWRALQTNNISNNNKMLVIYAGDKLQKRSNITILPWDQVADCINFDSL